MIANRPIPRSGFSLVEVLVATTLLTIVMMGLAGAAGVGLSQMGKARQDLLYAADVQQVADSLVAVGWNNVTSGSVTIRGRVVSWTVTTLSPNSQQLEVIARRAGYFNPNQVVQDTLYLFLAKPTPGS